MQVVAAPAVIGGMAVLGTLDGLALGLRMADGTHVWERQLSSAIFGRRTLSAAGLAIVPEYRLWALDPASGRTIWSIDGPDGAIGATEPALAGDTLYASSAFGWVAAIDAATGQVLWQTDVGERAFRPTVTDSFVVVGTRGFLGAGRTGPLGAGHLIALHRATGAIGWMVALPDSAGFATSGGATNSGVVAGAVLVVGTYAGHVLGVQVNDGTVLWSLAGGAAPPVGPYERAPVLLGDLVVLTRGDGVVEGRQPSNGGLVWSRQAGTSGPTGDPVVHGGRMYTLNGPIRAFNADGTLHLESRGPSSALGFFGSVTVTEDGDVLAGGEEGGGIPRLRYMLLRTNR